MTWADVRGIDSHGAGSLLHYERLRAAGKLTLAAETRVVREDEATALLDGGGGLGHVPAEIAMGMAIERAREGGVATVAVRNSGHFGAAGAYASMAAQRGLIGVVTTNAARPAVVPTGGAEAMLGTNPLAFAAPTGSGPPLLLDMSTSTVPVGRIAVSTRRAGRLPSGWATDRRGRPDRNARRALAARRLTPLGGDEEGSSHKGYGLALMVEVLSTLLPGTAPPSSGESHEIGHFMLALDPARIRGDDGFGAALDRLLARLRASPALDPARPVLVAGDREHAEAERRRASGVPLDRALVEDLRGIASRAGVDFPFASR
jgi:LDH2 family malate/lactate/ureidoglycolate dehydrogenase